MKNFHSAKNTIKTCKREDTNGMRIFATHVTVKDFMGRVRRAATN